jgi:predicted RNase H-like HicB family nuclease|tara:strand:- start:2111 stop:2359 length:249 start_codon:yes stop_codon:yes gene_type:complete
MNKILLSKIKDSRFPVVVEKDEDGFYVVECALFKGCYSQGKTLDKALENIKKVIELCLEEKENQEILEEYKPRELSLHSITL